MNKKLTVILILALGAIGHAQAQTSSAQQSSASNSVAQGSIQFSTNPEHTSETIRNVGGIALGSAAFSASQLNCGQTTQGGVAFAGFSGLFGSSTSPFDCKIEVAASELVRQSTVDPINADRLREAAIQLRCRLNQEVYEAMQDAGFDCKRKPKELVSRTDTQPQSTRIAGN